MTCFSEEVRRAFKDAKHDKLCENLEGVHAELLKRRVDFVEYGDPDKLTRKARCKLNCQMMALALLHRAESLMLATGAMLASKNVYGLALVARGHVETTAVLGYFCKRVEMLTKGNIDFERFEKDIANGLLGAKHDLFSEADSPVNILTCVEQADKHLELNWFGGEKKGMLKDIYGWLSEFAHPNFCSNKSAFSLDKATGRMVFRHEGELQDNDFQLVGYMDISATMFPKLFDEFAKAYEAALIE